MDFKTFQNEIGNLKSYIQRREELIDEIEILWYQLSGVKGIQYNKQPMSFNQTENENRRLEIINKIDGKQKELNYVQIAIEQYENKLARLPSDVNGMCKLLFIKGLSYEQVGNIFNYSKNGIRYRVKSEVEKL